MRKPIIAALFAGVFVSVNTYAIDLVQVYQEALANDATYASARSALAAGQEKGVQGRAGLLPTVGLSGSYARQNAKTESENLADPIQSGPFLSKQYTLSLSQPLFRVANWESYQQGKLSVALSEAQFAQAQEDLIVRVSQAYFDVLTAQDTLASVQAQKVAITEQLASAKRNFEVGTNTITDTNEAQARYDLAVAQEIAAQSDLDVKRTTLQQIIGKPVSDLATLRPGIKINSPEPLEIRTWVESAQVQNYGVVSQQLQVETAQRQIKRNRAGHYPSVDLVANHGYNNNGWTTTFPDGATQTTNSVGVAVAIPIFSGFSVDSTVREAIALEDKARYDLEAARRSAEQNARQAYLGVTAGLAQVRALEAAEISSQSSLDSNKLAYQVGVRINIDVLNAQQQLYSTRQTLAKARYDTIMNGLKLKYAAGTLKEEDLAQVNALLTH
jgi:outer membrane protein